MGPSFLVKGWVGRHGWNNVNHYDYVYCKVEFYNDETELN